MSFVLTLVASSKSKPVGEQHFDRVHGILKKHDIRLTAEPITLAEEKAYDLGISQKPERSVMQALRHDLSTYAMDIMVTAIERRQKKLLIADMDSTIVRGETLNDMAEQAGVGDQVADITRRAMNGEIDFEGALNERVRLLKGFPVASVKEAVENTELNPGAEQFVRVMRQKKAFCVLVSGGFTHFTEDIANRVGFHAQHGNTLAVEGEALTGHVIRPILDKQSKLQFLEHYVDDLSVNIEDCLAIGDGANDLAMLTKAGLGIGYKPKPIVVESVDNITTYT